MSSVQCLVSSVQCPVSSVQCPVSSVCVQCPVSSVQCPVCSVKCAVSVSSVQCPVSVSSVQCPVSIVQCPILVCYVLFVLQVFMREEHKQLLQDRLQAVVLDRIVMLQKWFRGNLARCRFLALRRSTIVIQVRLLGIIQIYSCTSVYLAHTCVHTSIHLVHTLCMYVHTYNVIRTYVCTSSPHLCIT